VEKRAALGEEDLKIAIPDEGDHEEEEANGDEEKAGEGIGGFDEELVVRRGSQELGGGLNSVAERVNLLHVEHHQRPARDRYERVQDADHHERRRR